MKDIRDAFFPVRSIQSDISGIQKTASGRSFIRIRSLKTYYCKYSKHVCMHEIPRTKHSVNLLFSTPTTASKTNLAHITLIKLHYHFYTDVELRSYCVFVNPLSPDIVVRPALQVRHAQSVTYSFLKIECWRNFERDLITKRNQQADVAITWYFKTLFAVCQTETVE